MVSLIIPTVIHVVVTMIPVTVRTTCYTGRAVAWTTEVTTIPAVMHTNMIIVVGVRTIVVAVSVIVTISTMTMPGVTTTIGDIEVRTSEVEVVTMRVAEINAEVPVACLPVEGTVEIAGCHKGVPLPVVKDIAQVEITTLPVGAEHVSTTCHSHEIVEIDLVGCLVLLVVQIQLVSHLISQEQGLVASLLVAHGVGGSSANCHHHQCEKQLLHNRIVLNC